MIFLGIKVRSKLADQPVVPQVVSLVLSEDGTTFAFRQSPGASFDLRDLTKMLESGLNMIAVSSLNTLQCNPWGPMNVFRRSRLSQEKHFEFRGMEERTEMFVREVI